MSVVFFLPPIRIFFRSQIWSFMFIALEQYTSHSSCSLNIWPDQPSWYNWWKKIINLSKTFDKEIVKVSPLWGHLFLVEAQFPQRWPMLAFFLPNQSGQHQFLNHYFLNALCYPTFPCFIFQLHSDDREIISKQQHSL